MATPTLHTLAAKTLPSPCRPDTLAYCPTMDLVALGLADEVVVFRLNGEKVFGVQIPVEEGGEGGEVGGVSKIAWRRDGRMLAIASSDGLVRLVDVWTGKVVHRLTTSRPTDRTTTTTTTTTATASRISCLAYTTSSLVPSSSKSSDGNAQSLEDFLASLSPSSNGGSTKNKAKPDLPRELAMLDIESSLPKLSTLPATGGDDDIFSTRASIDAIFHSHTSSTISQNSQSNSARSRDTIDLLLCGTESGQVHIRIFDSFEIGSIDLTSALPSPPSPSRPATKTSTKPSLKVLHHASHPSLPTHYLVVSSPPSDLHLLTLHLPFLNSPHQTLPNLATKATQLSNLLRYLTQIHGQLAKELALAFELPGRFLFNIYDTLASIPTNANAPPIEETEEAKQKRGRALFETEVVVLVATGVCSQPLHDWLVDELGERGLKRWERAVSEGLDVVRRGLAECVLPALERGLVIISRLMGLSLARLDTGIDTLLLQQVQDTLDALVIVAHDALRVVGEEVRGFRAWMGWLRWTVEVEGCETAERREEVREGGAEGIEWMGVLGYVKGGGGVGVLGTLLGEGGEKDKERPREWDDKSYYKDFKNARSAVEAGSGPGSGGRRKEKGDVPGLGELVGRLNRLCVGVFEGIATNLRAGVRVGYVGALGRELDGAIMDVRVQVSEKLDTEVVVVSADSQQAPLLRCSFLSIPAPGPAKRAPRHRTRNLAVDIPPPETSTDSNSNSNSITALTFLPSDDVLVLTGNNLDSFTIIPNETEIEPIWTPRHVFTGTPGPARMAVNGRQGRGVVCVLLEGGGRYEVLDLEGDGEADDDDDDDEEEEDEERE